MPVARCCMECSYNATTSRICVFHLRLSPSVGYLVYVKNVLWCRAEARRHRTPLSHVCLWNEKVLDTKTIKKHFTQLNKWSQRFLKITSDAIETSQLNPVLARKKKQYTIQTMYPYLSSHKVVVKVNFCSYVLFLFSRIYKLTGVFQTIFNVVITSTPLESSTIICSFS